MKKHKKYHGELNFGEEHGFEAIVKWISNEPSSRSQDMSKLRNFSMELKVQMNQKTK